jgi:hypothetical protein
MAHNSKKRKVAPGSNAGEKSIPSATVGGGGTAPAAVRGGAIRKGTGKLTTSSPSSSAMPANAAAVKAQREQLHSDVSYVPMTLPDIHDRVQQLCYRVPGVPEGGFGLSSSSGISSDDDNGGGDDTKKPSAAAASSTPAGETNGKPPKSQNLLDEENAETLPLPSVDKTAVKQWATSMLVILEELNILMGCVYPATYVWGTDRSGAADQNLAMLNTELVRSQDHIATLVSSRINEVLTPVMSLVTKKTVTTKDDQTGAEIKTNYFETTPEDPTYVHMSHVALARNATMLRQVVLANLDKMLQAIKDYLAAQHKDSQHDSRGFVY